MFRALSVVLPLSLLCSACTGRYESGSVAVVAPYSRVVSTDLRGEVIAEYVAEGPVAQDLGLRWRDSGVAASRTFRFVALERTIFRPCRMTFCYPMGRAVTVAAPNLIATPLWSLAGR